MTEFVQYSLEDGTQVLFESAESDLVRRHGGDPEVRDGGRLADRFRSVAAAAEEVSQQLRSRLAPDEVSLEFGLKVSAEAAVWFFAKAQGEGTVKVTLKWAASAPASGPGAPERAVPSDASADGRNSVEHP